MWGASRFRALYLPPIAFGIGHETLVHCIYFFSEHIRCRKSNSCVCPALTLLCLGQGHENISSMELPRRLESVILEEDRPRIDSKLEFSAQSGSSRTCLLVVGVLVTQSIISSDQLALPVTPPCTLYAVLNGIHVVTLLPLTRKSEAKTSNRF